MVLTLGVAVKNWVMVHSILPHGLCLEFGVGAQERLQEEGLLTWVLKETPRGKRERGMEGRGKWWEQQRKWREPGALPCSQHPGGTVGKGEDREGHSTDQAGRLVGEAGMSCNPRAVGGEEG